MCTYATRCRPTTKQKINRPWDRFAPVPPSPACHHASDKSASPSSASFLFFFYSFSFCVFCCSSSLLSSQFGRGLLERGADAFLGDQTVVVRHVVVVRVIRVPAITFL